jgi:hypothetical protein
MYGKVPAGKSESDLYAPVPWVSFLWMNGEGASGSWLHAGSRMSEEKPYTGLMRLRCIPPNLRGSCRDLSALAFPATSHTRDAAFVSVVEFWQRLGGQVVGRQKHGRFPRKLVIHDRCAAPPLIGVVAPRERPRSVPRTREWASCPDRAGTKGPAKPRIAFLFAHCACSTWPTTKSRA